MIEIIEKIKSRGYWRVNFHPLIYEERLSPLSKCKDIVEKNAVRLRGWDYPHYPRRRGDDTGLNPGNDYYQGWIDWWSHKELWRMYQSGQFIHYRGLTEDWDDEENLTPIESKIPKMVYLGVAHTVYLITEIYEFLLGLVMEGIYREGVKVSISLYNARGRKLWLEDRGRVPFMIEKITGARNIEFNAEYNEKDIIDSSNELVIKVVLNFFERFEWVPSEDLIRKDQDELLKRKR